MVETCTSLAFGDNLVCAGADTSPLHFTGKERDSESGLDNFGARYNSSSLGRFMSPDPVLGKPVFPQSWNLYAYAANDPLNAVDPTGLDCIYTTQQTAWSVVVTIVRGDCLSDTDDGVYVNGRVNTKSFSYDGKDLGYSFSNDQTGGAGVISLQQPSNGNSDALNANAVAIFSDINRRNIIGNTFKLYGAGALIGATGGAAWACYYLCPAAGVALGTAAGTAGLEELATEGIQQLAELLQTGETLKAEAYILALSETPEGQTILRAMETKLADAIGRMGPVGSPAAMQVFQNLKAMIEPYVRH